MDNTAHITDEVLLAIERIVNILAPNFKFGCYELDDIKQQGRIFALEGLRRYDAKRPLPNFLYSHVRNRLINFRRDKSKHRNEPPCLLCHDRLADETDHPDGKFCSVYRTWQKQNHVKNQIFQPVSIDNVAEESFINKRTTPDNIVNITEKKEIFDIIDRHLPVELRSTYLKMKSGVSVPKAKRTEVEQTIIRILKWQNAADFQQKT